MSNEPRKIELAKQIADLDRQMGLAIDRQGGRSGRLNPRYAKFPTGEYVVAILLVAWWLLGRMVAAGIHEMTMPWAMVVAAIVLLYALYRTVRFVGHKMSSRKGGYSMEETEEVATLRKKRDALRKELDALR